MDATTIEDPTPPPRRKKEQKSMKKPPVMARTKKDFTQLHQDFAPSEVTLVCDQWYELYGFMHQLLEQRKLSDVTMTIADDTNESHNPEKPRRKRKHFKLVKCEVDYVQCFIRSPDHVSQGEGHVSHSVDTTTQVDSDIVPAMTSDDLSNDDITDDVTNTDDEQLTTTSTVTTNNKLPSVVDDVTSIVTEHTVDHVITSDDQVIPDDQSQIQNVTSSIKDSPGGCWCASNIT